ncbi:MAG: ABC transporter ATP-binding protein [bacterium]|nr:ABC transporter ATP-binding protein [bacterium]
MKSIISVKGLSKSYGKVKAVNHISLEVEEGELVGFLGENGAGKTTTINMLCTLQKMEEGEVEICGYQLGKEDNEIRKNIGVVFQNNTLDDFLTVKENLLMRASLYNTDKSVNKEQLKKVSELLDITDLLKVRYKTLSGGQKRRVEIARALMNAPKILFLDEPTTGLDPQTRKTVWNLINTLRKEYKMTVFLTTHYMEEAALADHIIILEKGMVIEDATPMELKDRYAHDRLIIQPNDKEKALRILKKFPYRVHVKQSTISIHVKESKNSIALLKELEPYIDSFEVVKGTMDDVFLEVTKSPAELEKEEAC